MIRYLFITLSTIMIYFVGCAPKDVTPAKPDIIVQDTSLLEGNTTVKMAYRVGLSHIAQERITIDYEVVAGTARADFDFTPAQNQRLVFEPGSMSSSIEVEIFGEQIIESDETFFINFLYAENANLETTQVTVTIVNDDVDNSQAGELVIPESGYLTPDNYPNMTMVWNDEFDQGALNMDDWTFEIGDGCPSLCGWGNGELQYYTSQNTSLVNGNLVIEAKKESVGGRDYTSSRIITKNKQSFQYGRIDIRANLPYSQGIWPALWMLGDNIDQVSWPACGEIDIMEMIGGDADGRDNTVHGTLHWSEDGNHAYYGGLYSLNEGIFNNEYHVFSLVWDANTIKWYVDDQLYHSQDISTTQKSEFRDSFFFVVNIAVGGNWPGSPTVSTVLPQYLIVDYIRVFQEI